MLEELLGSARIKRRAFQGAQLVIFDCLFNDLRQQTEIEHIIKIYVLEVKLMQQYTPRDQERQPGKEIGRGSTLYLLFWLLVTLSFLVWLFYQPGLQTARIDYSTFREEVQRGNVVRIKVTGEKIEGEFKEPVRRVEDESEKPAEYSTFVTYLPSFGDEQLFPLLQAHSVAIETEPASSFNLWTLILSILPFLLLVGLFYFLMNRARPAGDGAFSMLQSRARLYDQREEAVTFDDVAGLDGAKIELREIIEYLKDPWRVRRLGGTVPKGVLLVGPPGTGKTLLARAVAGEAGVPFFSITGSDFMELFVGVGASRVRRLFEDARKAAPSIIFIDELDSIGRLRGTGIGGGHDEREQTLNQLLSELDGFEPSENVIVMAATNRPDILDPALLRPGRFDRRVTVDLPSLSARRQILEIHARNKPLASDVDLGRLAQGTPGFSGADLENVLNEAALMAARRHKQVIELEDIEEARDKVLMGLVREGIAPTEEERELIAYHEAGHAVIAAVLPHADPIHKVTIVPRGRAMGVTQQLPERERLLYTREYLLDHLAVMMGGRAAEEMVLGTVTSGAENDLKQATQMARQMVLDLGMSERLGHVALGSQRQFTHLGEEGGYRREFSETTAREVDEEIKRILDTAYEHAVNTLRKYRGQLDAVAKALLVREELTGEEVLELVNSSLPIRERPAEIQRVSP